MADAYSSKGVTTSYDPDKLDLRKMKKKWSSKKEFDRVFKVRKRWDAMQLGRRSSCPWSEIVTDYGRFETTNENREGAGTGTNWKYRWDMDYKLWSMWHEYLEEYSNVKSPTSFAPIEAIMAEFADNNIGLLLTATQESDKDKVMLLRHIIKYWESKSRVSETNSETFKECLITGTAFRGVFWKRVEREVNLIQSSQRITQEIYEQLASGNKEEVEKANKLIKEQRKPVTQKTTIVEYDDVAHVPISVYELWWDPDARNTRGHSYDASDVVWRQIPSLEQFRAEYNGSRDPYIITKNIDKVTPSIEAQADYGDMDPFFEAPDDFNGSNQLELLHYYNKRTDKYIIIANDVLIRDGPLPYNHKQIPIIKHTYNKFPYQFYGMGLPVVLEALQSEDEALRNLRIEQAKIDTAPPLYVNSEVFDDVDESWERSGEPGRVTPINGDPTRSLAWGPQSRYNPNTDQIRSGLQQDSISISGINPITYAMPRPGEAVRNNMMAVESSLKQIKKGIKNYAEGYREAMLQTIALMTQYYPSSYLESLDANGERKKTARSIRTQGVQIINETLDIDGDEYSILNTEDLDKDDYGYFELNDPSYFDLDGDVDIQIDTDTLVPISQGLKMQNADRFLETLIPILSNQELTQNKAIQGLLRYYYEVNGVPLETMEQLSDDNSQEDIDIAFEQNEAMLNGKIVPSIPGESNDHVQVHYQALLHLTSLKTKFETMPELSDPNITLQQLNEVNGVIDQVNKSIAIITQHLQGDTVSKQDAAQYSTEVASQSLTPQQPEAPEQPMPPEQMPPEATQGAMPTQGMTPPGPAF